MKRVTAPKQRNLGKISKGVGSFSIQKYILQIFDLQTGLFEHEIEKRLCLHSLITLLKRGSHDGLVVQKCLEPTCLQRKAWDHELE